MLGHDATHQDAQSHANVPRDEDGRVGCAALVVLCHIDHHVLECGPHVSVAQSDEQGRAVVAHQQGERCGIGRECGHEYKQGVAHQRDDHSLSGIVGEPSFAQGAPSLQP